MPCLSGLKSTAHILASLFNFASRQHFEVWDSQYPLFKILRPLLHLMKLAYKARLTGLWHMLSNNLPLAYLSLQSLQEDAGLDQGLVFSLMCKSSLWQNLVGPLWQRSLGQILAWIVIRVAGSSLVLVHPPVTLTLNMIGSHGEQCSWFFTIYIIFICCAGWYTFWLLSSVERHHFH